MYTDVWHLSNRLAWNVLRALLFLRQYLDGFLAIRRGKSYVGVSDDGVGQLLRHEVVSIVNDDIAVLGRVVKAFIVQPSHYLGSPLE